MRLSSEPIQPITKTRSVPLDQLQAFALFTRRMADWWPLPTHSIAGDGAEGVRFEENVGGRVVEVTTTGQEHPWADVIAWDPPHRFVLAWHPTEDPNVATIVEVRFEAVDADTRLDLEHRAWEELGATDGQATRNGYDAGWDLVLQPYEEAARNFPD